MIGVWPLAIPSHTVTPSLLSTCFLESFTMLRSRFVSSLLLSALVLGAPGLEQAQTYPDRPLSLIHI